MKSNLYMFHIIYIYIYIYMYSSPHTGCTLVLRWRGRWCGRIMLSILFTLDTSHLKISLLNKFCYVIGSVLCVGIMDVSHPCIYWLDATGLGVFSGAVTNTRVEQGKVSVQAAEAISLGLLRSDNRPWIWTTQGNSLHPHSYFSCTRSSCGSHLAITDDWIHDKQGDDEFCESGRACAWVDNISGAYLLAQCERTSWYQLGSGRCRCRNRNWTHRSKGIARISSVKNAQSCVNVVNVATQA